MDIFQMVRCDSRDDILRAIGSIDINILNEDKENLLHEAIAHNPEIALELIERNINVNQQTKNNAAPLHYAAHHNQLEIARKIIEKGGDINLTDKHGNNPLWYAVFFAKGHYDLVKLLMKHGADPHNKNKAGRSALDFAKQIDDKVLIDLLSRGEN